MKNSPQGRPRLAIIAGVVEGGVANAPEGGASERITRMLSHKSPPSGTQLRPPRTITLVVLVGSSPT